MALYLETRFLNYQLIKDSTIVVDLETMNEMAIVGPGHWYTALCISVNGRDNSNAIGKTYAVYKGVESKARVVAPCPPFCNSDGPDDN